MGKILRRLNNGSTIIITLYIVIILSFLSLTLYTLNRRDLKRQSKIIKDINDNISIVENAYKDIINKNNNVSIDNDSITVRLNNKDYFFNYELKDNYRIIRRVNK